MQDIKNNENAMLSPLEIQSVFAQTLDDFTSSNNQTARLPNILDTMSKRIEHTLLKMNAVPMQLTQLCNDAIQYDFRGVCCLQRYVGHCASILEGSGVLIVSVVDFPLCGATPKGAVHLAQSAIAHGANEIDMVLDVSSLKAGRPGDAFDRIALMTDACGRIPVKVILETAYLTETEIVTACAISKAAGAAFVKTSTGFATRGASLRDIEIMKTAVGDTMRIKASGGIKDAVFANALVAAGADVIGTSAGMACVG